MYQFVTLFFQQLGIWVTKEPVRTLFKPVETVTVP